MISLSEIDTTTKRATKAIGFSWGIDEEVGKNMKTMELFGLPGVKNLNEYFKNYPIKKFQKISLISEKNISQKIPYCPIISGVNFLDQINTLEKISFPYHYNYSREELDNLVKKAEQKNATLLTTEKDYLRIDENYKKNISYVKITTEIENKKQFIEEIKKII